MLKNNNIANAKEFEQFTRESIRDDEYSTSRTQAALSGWDSEDYAFLLLKYLQSTQITCKTSTDKKELKGDPLEEVVRYFLEKGGFVRKIESLKHSGIWEIDGQGIIHTDRVKEVLGREDTIKIGTSMILECKNKSKPVSTDEFSKYTTRMSMFGCQLGVIASTNGFAISSGKGIAEEIYYEFRSNKFHLLLCVEDFCKTHFEKIPPLHILVISLNNTKFNKYKFDKALQERMSLVHCQKVAKEKSEALKEELDNEQI